MASAMTTLGIAPERPSKPSRSTSFSLNCYLPAGLRKCSSTCDPNSSGEMRVQHSEFKVQAKNRNDDGPSVAVVAWIVDVLQVERGKHAAPKMRGVVGFPDVLASVTQFSISQQET